MESHITSLRRQVSHFNSTPLYSVFELFRGRGLSSQDDFLRYLGTVRCTEASANGLMGMERERYRVS